MLKLAVQHRTAEISTARILLSTSVFHASNQLAETGFSCPSSFASFAWPTRCGQHVGMLKLAVQHRTAEISTARILLSTSVFHASNQLAETGFCCPSSFSSFAWPTRCGQHVGRLRLAVQHRTAEIQTKKTAFYNRFL